MTADDTVTARLAQWAALTGAATEGPWTFEPAGESECGEPQCCYEYWDNRIWADGAVLTESHMLSDADAEFIAHARTAMPALLGFARDVRAIHRVAARGDECASCCERWPCRIEEAARKWIRGEG